MEYRTLGRGGVRVSPLALGTMMFGGATDEPTSRRIIARAREAGLNFIDTADQYNAGKSEEIVGSTIKSERDAWVLATKLVNAMGPGPNQRGLSRGWMHRAIDASLARLGTDYIDIYYFHKEDPDTPLETSVAAMEISSVRARSAISASPISAPGASPRSAACATSSASAARS